MRRATPIWIFLLVAGAAFAQRLVTVNFAAADADGRPVTDLTAAEIQITDSGKPQPAVAFRNEALRSPAAPGEIANRAGAGLSHAQVVLFDLMNLSLDLRKPAIDRIVRTLEKLENPDALYLYLLGIDGELTPVRALPEGPVASQPPAAPWVRDARTLLEKAVGPVAGLRPDIHGDIVLRVQRSYAALQNLAGRMAPMPGRKNILWITFGVKCDIPQEGGQIWDCRPNLYQATSRLDAANVSVSPVAMQAAGDDPESNVTLQLFVEGTGGKFYTGGNIERAIPESLEMAQASYRVQYGPAASVWDGKVHKLKVASTRKGVTVFAKQSYMAPKAPAQPEEKDRALAMFRSPFDAADIGLKVALTPGAQPRSLHLRIGLDVQDLLLTKQGDRYTGQLASYVAAYLPDNRLQEYPVLPINLALTEEQYTRMSKDGIRLGQDVAVPEGATRIRLLLMDRVAGVAGSLTIPVK